MSYWLSLTLGLAVWVAFALLILLCQLAGRAIGHSGSWLRSSDSRRLLFRRPLVDRITCAILAFLLFAGPGIPLLILCFHPTMWPVSVSYWLSLTLGLAVLWDLALLLLWLGASYELEIDLRQRTYRRQRRWLLGLRMDVRAGSLTEFIGIRWSGRGSVFLSFSGQPSLGFTIGMFVNGTEANAAAREIGRAIDLPVLCPPE